MSIWVGRPGMALNALFFSGFILTIINPLILWDVGFQLSFMATLDLIVLVPPLERIVFGLLQRHLKTEHVGLTMALLSELLIITLAAQIIPLSLSPVGNNCGWKQLSNRYAWLDIELSLRVMEPA